MTDQRGVFRPGIVGARVNRNGDTRSWIDVSSSFDSTLTVNSMLVTNKVQHGNVSRSTVHRSLAKRG